MTNLDQSLDIHGIMKMPVLAL